MTLDFWYNHSIEDVTAISVSFSDLDCIYRGNMYVNGLAVGDFTTTSSTLIEETFKVKFS